MNDRLRSCVRCKLGNRAMGDRVRGSGGGRGHQEPRYFLESEARYLHAEQWDDFEARQSDGSMNLKAPAAKTWEAV